MDTVDSEQDLGPHFYLQSLRSDPSSDSESYSDAICAFLLPPCFPLKCLYFSFKLSILQFLSAIQSGSLDGDP